MESDLAQTEFHPVVLNWRLTELHGWGLVGVHTCLHLLRHGGVPLLYEAPSLETMRPKTLEALQGLVEPSQNFNAVVARTTENGQRLYLENSSVYYALGGHMQPGLGAQPFFGAINIGVGAFTETVMSDQAQADARSYDRLIIHSSFNQQVLADHGIASELVFQGIDPTEVSPGPRTDQFAGRFVVFSGGKIEFRKGQDIVVAAFRIFHQRHPDALLVTAWGNFWPALAFSLAESPLMTHPLTFTDTGMVDTHEWLRASGLPEGSFKDLGFFRRDAIGPLLRDCDLGIFPNRCEPGTNLVAMEAMACGLPVILSANTGHLDLIADDRTYALTRQQPVAQPSGDRRYWGESDVEELVEAMEFAYQNRDDARAKGAAAADWILNNRRWDQFAAHFVAAGTRPATS